MTDLVEFYYLSHILISLVGGILLLSLYYNIRNRFRKILVEDDNQNRVDKGLLYLSLAMFVWVLSGLWGYLNYEVILNSSMLFQLGVNLFSILNNMFLLLALFHFQYAPSFISNNEKNVKWLLVIIIVVAILTSVLTSFSSSEPSQGIRVLAIPDFLLSAFLSVILMITLYKTFAKRALSLVGILAVLTVALILYSQLPEIFIDFGNSFSNDLIKIVAKSSLISIFLVLATTWVIDLANTPSVKEIQIRFLDWSLVQINIPSKNIVDANVDFGSKTTQFKNLFKFAVRRKFGNGQSQSMEIGAAGEIKSQTYLTRIIENLNAILDQKDEMNLERKDLFTFLGEGRYRLRILPDNIIFENNLLNEFSQNKEFLDYQEMINTSS